MSFLKNIKTGEQLQAEKEAAANNARIAELTKLLSDTDFKVMPDYDKPIGDLKEQRQSWRDEIRALQPDTMSDTHAEVEPD